MPQPASSTNARSGTGTTLGIAVVLAVVTTALVAALTFTPATALPTNERATAQIATDTNVSDPALRAKNTWREVQAQRLIDKVKAKDWEWVKPRLRNPKRDFPEVKKMREAKPLKLADCEAFIPAETTAACYLRNTWAFGITKDGNKYTYYGFAPLD